MKFLMSGWREDQLIDQLMIGLMLTFHTDHLQLFLL